MLINLYKEEPLITYIFTRKKFTGKGMATDLLNRAKYELFQLNYKKLNLYVNKENTKAIDLYLKSGFTITQ
ncbi:MAG: GNAT family N-acetyltransferase [Bacteroidia bacterium]